MTETISMKDMVLKAMENLPEVWSQKARNNVREIVRYIARDKPIAAELFGRRIFTATRRLKNFPKSGRVVPEENEDNLRELIIGSYRIIYEI